MSKGSDQHYLRLEFNRLLCEDPTIVDFIDTGSLDGMWYWDLENPADEWMSNQFWTTLGYDPAEMPHKSAAWQDIIDKDDLVLATENFRKHCEDPDHKYDQVVRYRHKNGSIVWIRCRGIAIRDSNGVPIRMLGAHTDITELKNVETQLAQRNKELASTNAELKNFAYAASHDIRGPIITLVDLLTAFSEDTKDVLDEEAQELLSMICKSAERTKSLTKGILEYAHSDSCQEDIRDIDCNKLLDEISIDLKQQLQESGCQLLAKDLPTIYGQPIPTRQIFLNLVSNAIKFQKLDEHHKGCVTVSCETLPDGWKFSVSDNGIGIAPEQQKNVFEAFKKLNTPCEYSGNGLGLSLCSKVAHMHGGDIWVDSKLGKGSTFHFTYKDSRPLPA